MDVCGGGRLGVGSKALWMLYLLTTQIAIRSSVFNGRRSKYIHTKHVHNVKWGCIRSVNKFKGNEVSTAFTFRK